MKEKNMKLISGTLENQERGYDKCKCCGGDGIV